MLIAIHDPGLRAGLEAALGHGAPFLPEELAGVASLHVQGADDVSELRHCPAVTRLKLIACSMRSLAPLTTLDHLESLQILACPIDDAAALHGCRALVDLSIDFTFLRSLEPLLELPALRRGRFLGNPLEDASWSDLRRRWRRTASPLTGKPRVLEFGRRDAWETTRLLWDQGVFLCFGAVDGHRSILVRPGAPRLEGASFDATQASSAGVHAALEHGTSTEELFRKSVAFADGKGLIRPTDISAHRILGDHEDAESWIAAAPDEDREHLRRFIRRFPTLIFFREDDTYLAILAADSGASVPAALAVARRVLAGAQPDDEANFRVDAYTGSSPRSDDLDEVWYYPQLGEYYDDERKELLGDKARVFPLAVGSAAARSILAAPLSDSDRAIYELTEEALYMAVREKRPLTRSVYRVYESHAEMLAHIVAFKLDDGTVIEALPDPKVEA